MARSRFYAEELGAVGDRVELDVEEARHLTRVLRVHEGELVILFDGRGEEALARVDAVGKHGAGVRIEERYPRRGMPAVEIRLAVALPRAGGKDDLLRRVIEVGVSEIQPIITERSVARPDRHTSERRAERRRRIALAAMKQCRRNVFPVWNDPILLSDLSLGEGELGVFGSVMASSASPSRWESMHPNAERVCVVVGPEGGLTPEEEQAQRARGFEPVRLGATVLRVETAAVGLALWLASLERAKGAD